MLPSSVHLRFDRPAGGSASFELINYVNEQATMRITTGVLNSVLADATARVQPPTDKGRRLKIYYMTQIGVQPASFRDLLQRRQTVPFLLSALSGKPDPRYLRPGGNAHPADHPSEGRKGGGVIHGSRLHAQLFTSVLHRCWPGYFLGCVNGALTGSQVYPS